MKTLRRHEKQLGLERCACGAVAGIHVRQTGDVRLYQISCGLCGVETAQSERYEDAASEWNESFSAQTGSQSAGSAGVKEIPAVGPLDPVAGGGLSVPIFPAGAISPLVVSRVHSSQK